MAKKGFTIFRVNLSGKVDDYYFKSWDNAKASMDTLAGGAIDRGATITASIDEYIKKEKKRVYKKEGVSANGNMFTMELINAKFND